MPGVVDRLTTLAGAVRPTIIAAARRLPSRRTAAGAVAGTVVAAAVVTAVPLTLVALAPAPGWGGAGWMTLELDVITPPEAAAPLSRREHRSGAAPMGSSSPGPITQPAGEFVGWAILDRRTGSITGSATMTQVSTTASLIKVWIVADYLRLASEQGWRPSSQRLSQLEHIIRDSHNGHAEAVYRELGAAESIERLISRCRLTDSRPYHDFWSNTQLSPRDTARLGACIADGHAAGPEWTDWLLAEMREVRGSGDFGIRHAFPEPDRAGIAIKNGWIDRDYDQHWHVNCLAIGDTWTMGVMVRFPVRLGFQHGADLCRSLAEEHLLAIANPTPVGPPAGPAPA